MKSWVMMLQTDRHTHTRTQPFIVKDMFSYSLIGATGDPWCHFTKLQFPWQYILSQPAFLNWAQQHKVGWKSLILKILDIFLLVFQNSYPLAFLLIKNWPRGVTHVLVVSGHPWARGKYQPNQTIPVFGLFGHQSWLTSRNVCGHVARATCILRAPVESPWVVDDVRHWKHRS